MTKPDPVAAARAALLREQRNRHFKEAQELIGFVRCGYLDLRTYAKLLDRIVDCMCRVESAEMDAAAAWTRVADLEATLVAAGAAPQEPEP